MKRFLIMVYEVLYCKISYIYSYKTFKYLQLKSMASPFGNIISVVTIATVLEPSMFAELTLGIETSDQNSFLLNKQRSISKINNVESLRSKEINNNVESLRSKEINVIKMYIK